MATRTVLKVNMECNKCRRVALQSITQIEGIEMISINKKEQTTTVEGDADPVCITNQLKRKFKRATVISVGPPPPPPPNPTQKKGNKNGNDKSKPTTPPPKPVDPPPPCFVPFPTPCIMTYAPCKPRTGFHPPQPQCQVYYVYNEENPSPCTIS